MSKFYVSDILITKEDANGDIQANPTLIELCAEEWTLKENQASAETNCLVGGGDASPMLYGGSTFSGGAKLTASVDNMPIVLSHVLGETLTATDATAEVWATATAHAVGDMINHTDGVHTLVCYTAGTTGASEPTLDANPLNDRNTRVTDGTVVWIAMPLLKSYTFQYTKNSPTFTVEIKLDDGIGGIFYKQYKGVYMSQLPLTFDGNTIAIEINTDFLGSSAIDSTMAGWVENLGTITGAKTVGVTKDYFGGTCDLIRVYADDVLLTGTESVAMTIDRGLTQTKLANCESSVDGKLKLSGNMNREFTIADYEAFKDATEFKLSFESVALNGCNFKVNFEKTKPSKTDPDLQLDKCVYLNTELSAYGDATTVSVNASCIAPALVNKADGTIIGTY
jgi:hypothetical protein